MKKQTSDACKFQGYHPVYVQGCECAVKGHGWKRSSLLTEWREVSISEKKEPERYQKRRCDVWVHALGCAFSQEHLEGLSVHAHECKCTLTGSLLLLHPERGRLGDRRFSVHHTSQIHARVPTQQNTQTHTYSSLALFSNTQHQEFLISCKIICHQQLFL